jgi:low temperature requirement protein LtrA
MLAVMIFGLFMNAGIGRAFDDQPWLFLVPFLVCRIEPALLWVLTGTALQDHYAAMLTWFTATAVVWVGGALATAEHRLWWWTPGRDIQRAIGPPAAPRPPAPIGRSQLEATGDRQIGEPGPRW